MRFRSYDSLRLFDVVARRQSITEAAMELNLSKGAVSYQIRRLEQELGFSVFQRKGRLIALTESGRELWHRSQAAFRDLEDAIARLRDGDAARITVGTTTYFASRWLSPRLMTFLVAQPRVALRLQPMIDINEGDRQGIDMTIRWGRGEWTDREIEPLLACPAFVAAGRRTAALIAAQGLAVTLPQLALLHDRDGSEAWREWHRAAGLTYRDTRAGLVIPDPNVRVQAVIDEQGLALQDALVADELESGRLVKVSQVELSDYGYYLAYRKGALGTSAVKAFRDWIVSEAAQAGEQG